MCVTITHAAIRKGGRIWTGSRHGQIIPQVLAETGQRVSQAEQGFLGSDGKFYSRAEAGAIAFAAGQTRICRENLLSEDLW